MLKFWGKQNKIGCVYSDLVSHYEGQEIYRAEVTRGTTTVRVHAKTFDGLNSIQKALAKIEEDESIVMSEIG